MPILQKDRVSYQQRLYAKISEIALKEGLSIRRKRNALGTPATFISDKRDQPQLSFMDGVDGSLRLIIFREASSSHAAVSYANQVKDAFSASPKSSPSRSLSRIPASR